MLESSLLYIDHSVKGGCSKSIGFGNSVSDKGCRYLKVGWFDAAGT